MAITKELVNRINLLARKKKNEELTPEEILEQQELRQKYLAGIRAQVVDQLQYIHLEPETKPQSTEKCSCGCNHHHDHQSNHNH